MVEAPKNEFQEKFSGLEKISPLLLSTYQEALEYFSQDHDSWDIFTPKDGYEEVEAASYDCHSFLLALLRKELQKTKLPNLVFTTPLREDYHYETDWLYDIVPSARKSPEFESYIELMKKLTKEISELSHHIPVPFIESHFDGSGDYIPEYEIEREKKVAEIMSEVIENLQIPATSRVLLFSASSGDKFVDVHSSFVLGVTPDCSDILVIERREVGSPIEVRKLSKVIEDYTGVYGNGWPNLQLNILKSQIQDISSIANYN